MKKKKEEESGELVNGQRFPTFDERPEVTIRDFGDSEPAPKTRRERFNDKFIKREGGTLARRGSVTARRAENREAARKRAQAAATKRKQAKNK